MATEIARVESESGVLATLVFHPEYIFHSEDLWPDHFFEKGNQCLYAAIRNLAERGIKTVDAFGIFESITSSPAVAQYARNITIDQVNDFIERAEDLARHTLEEYKLCVENIMDAAFRREALIALRKCERMCSEEEVDNIEQEIYRELDEIMVRYSVRNEIPPYSEVIDDCWKKIEERQQDGYAGIPFKFPTLNEYATIERGELFIFGAEQKQGKSMMLLNCAVDLLKQDKKVLYLDSELNTRLFTARILAHLSGIEYKRVVSGAYNDAEKAKIDEAREWMKSRKFTHIYIPVFDQQSAYTAIKKVYHTQGIDVLIVDYFKSRSEGDAFDSYQELGRFVDMIKNQICGDMNIAGIGAAQATATGKLADSAKIARNASTIAMISDKSPDEIEADGEECGNKKLRVTVNRNGMQHANDEYIDLRFDGNHILYEEAKQHVPQDPFE